MYHNTKAKITMMTQKIKSREIKVVFSDLNKEGDFSFKEFALFQSKAFYEL